MNMKETCERCNRERSCKQLWMDPNMAITLKNSVSILHYSSETNNNGQVCVKVCLDCCDDLTRHIKDVKADPGHPYHFHR